MKYESYERKMAKCHDEFDVYFARAKLDEELAKEQQEKLLQTSERRGSLPDATGATLTIEVPSHHRRALSCKLPSRKRSRKSKKENSPKSKENSPPCGDTAAAAAAQLQPESLSHSSSAQSVVTGGVSMSYVTEPTLRAPSPRMGSQKSSSAPHSRSSSWKNKRRPKSGVYAAAARDSSESSPEQSRSRNSSITRFEEDVANKLEELKTLQSENALVVRNFTLSSKGVINRGDSFKRKPQRQLTPETLAAAVTTSTERAAGGDKRPSDSELTASAQAASPVAAGTTNVSRVLVIGDRGVGKTALLQQFMTSQYMGAAETSFGKFLIIASITCFYIAVHWCQARALICTISIKQMSREIALR